MDTSSAGPIPVRQSDAIPTTMSPDTNTTTGMSPPLSSSAAPGNTARSQGGRIYADGLGRCSACRLNWPQTSNPLEILNKDLTI